MSFGTYYQHIEHLLTQLGNQGQLVSNLRHKQNSALGNNQGNVQTTGGFSVENSLQTVIFTEILQEKFNSILKLICNGNV